MAGLVQRTVHGERQARAPFRVPEKQSNTDVDWLRKLTQKTESELTNCKATNSPVTKVYNL